MGVRLRYRTASTGDLPVTAWTVACDLEDLIVDRPHGVRLTGTSVCLVHTAGEVDLPTEPVRTFPVRVIGGVVYVGIS